MRIINPYIYIKMGIMHYLLFYFSYETKFFQSHFPKTSFRKNWIPFLEYQKRKRYFEMQTE